MTQVGVIARVGTKQFLGTEAKAHQVLDILSWAGLEPEKIGVTEPVRQGYDRGAAVSLWMETIRGPRQIAGGLMAVSPKKRFDISVDWRKGPHSQPNSVTFHVDNKVMAKDTERYLSLFRRLFVELGGLYGYISERTAVNRQFVPGSIEKLFPGVFWCTAIDQTLVEFFGGRERLKAGPWHTVEELGDGSLLFLLSQSPLDPALIASPDLEDTARSFLGRESFGNRALYEADPFREQVCKMPSLVLPDIRVPI